MPVTPRDVHKALAILETDLAGARRIREIAATCAVSPRTLQKNFRGFLGTTPTRARQSARLGEARRQLLSAGTEDSVTAIATRCGFQHLGRFAVTYRKHFGETPSATLRRRTSWLSGEPSKARNVPPGLDRPVVVVHPIAAAPGDEELGLSMSDVLAVAFLRGGWLVPGRAEEARYQLWGRIRRQASLVCVVTVWLSDTARGRMIWADRWSVSIDSTAGLDEGKAERLAGAIENAVRIAEIDRARRKASAELSGWEWLMVALPEALTLSGVAQTNALEMLGRAMERAPHDALPVALAAWCHAQRATHHFVSQPAKEKQRSKELVHKAERLGTIDARAEALLAAAETLSHDLEAGARHAERALALDGACSWGWIRKGFVHAYRGQSADARECFQIARALGPDDPLAFSGSIGMGVAQFEIDDFNGAVRWWNRLLAEHPSAVWAHRFIAPAYLMMGEGDAARRSFQSLVRNYPELTLRDIRAALPHTQRYMDRACEGLEMLGMRL